MKRMQSFIAVLLFGLSLVACKKDEINPPNNTNTPDRRGTYVGTIADAGGGGALTVNVGVAKVVDILPVSGVYRPASGGTVTLSGTYNTANDSMYASGGGYTFAGRFNGGLISGSFTGPNGAGIFTLAASSATNPVSVYTGSFVAGDDHGPFNFSISGSTLSGVAYVVNQSASVSLAGTVQGANITIVDPARNNRVIGTGTISNNGNSVSGQTIGSNGQPNGTWSGTKVQ
ncbi:MAG: hypothetical protein C4326_08925 [Ignavibacteria bacterium]